VDTYPATLAAALIESLELAGRIQPSMLIGTNFGICATVDGKLVVKAPDWFYVRSVLPSQPQPKPSQLHQVRRGSPGDRHGVLSETDGGEYSIKAKYPPGKWYYYERILQALTYAIFGAEAGWLEVYQLDAGDGISLSHRMPIDATGLQALSYFWVQATKPIAQVTGCAGGMNPGKCCWGTERLQQEQQLRERMAAKLRELGINPEEV